MKNYKKLKTHKGIYKHCETGKYMARKKVQGKVKTRTFKSLFDAKKWMEGVEVDAPKESACATLKEVWGTMQESHFPNLAASTQAIWRRRYTLLKKIEDYPMDELTSSVVTTWVQNCVAYFRSEGYDFSRRGKAGRCNMDNELNLLVTIFNWYKESEQYEKEAVLLVNPVKKKHKTLGFIRAKDPKIKQITLDDALKFFNYLKPMYRDLAMVQYFTASRIGEVAGIQIKNIDLDSRRLIIKETCYWDATSKLFVALNPHPKNKEPRVVFITKELEEIIRRRLALKIKGCDFLFHVGGSPLNYGTIQANYREAQRKARLPYSGTHILRHGMAALARKVGGGLDAVIAMTGHKDFKLADHYSKMGEEVQKDVSEKIMQVIRDKQAPSFENVITLKKA